MDPALPPGPRYNAVAIALHWLTAALIAVAVPLGASLHGLPRVPSSYAWYNAHKWLGASVFFIVVVRLLWRWRHPPPSLPPAMPAWQRRVAAGSHGVLYVMLLLLPTVGWLASQAGGHPLVLFNVLPLPAPVPVDEALNQTLHRVHAVLAWALVGLVAMHTAAALKHRLVDRDEVFSRMAGSSRPSRP